jgi:neutral amino acid transport system substrate-binding protein
LALLPLFGCNSAARNTFTIGELLSLQGGASRLSQAYRESIDLAAAEMEAGGGVLGNGLTFVNKDDASDPMMAATAAQALVALNVPAVIGGIFSTLTQPSAEVTSAAKIVEVTGTSTAPLFSMTHSTTTRYLFRTCASDALQGKLLAERAHAKGFTSAGIIHATGGYGVGLAQVFAAEFTALGGIITDDLEYMDHQPSYKQLYDQIFAAGKLHPEAILLVALDVDAAQLINDYNPAFVTTGTFFFFTDAIYDPNFVKLVGDPKQLAFPHEGTGPAIPMTPEHATFVSAFTARTGAPPTTSEANYYDALYLVAGAIEAGGRADGPTIAANIQAVSRQGAKFTPGQWKDFKAAIDAGMDVDYEGASGHVDIDDYGDVETPYDVWQFDMNGIPQVIVAGANP